MQQKNILFKNLFVLKKDIELNNSPLKMFYEVFSFY